MPLRLKLNENLWSKLKHIENKNSLKKTSLYDVVKTAREKEGNLINVHYATIANGGEYPYSIKIYGESNSVRNEIPVVTRIIDSEDNLYLLTDNLQEIIILLNKLERTGKNYSSTIKNKEWD